MKLPMKPPPLDDLLRAALAEPASAERFLQLQADRAVGPAPGGKYRHWDTFRHLEPPPGVTAEERWLAVKMARRALYQVLPLRDVQGRPFVHALPGVALEMLHAVDRDASGNIRASDQVTSPATRDTYLFKSLVEEAITSSQLEGASTTRKVAKAMIQEGREPRNRSERMIYNNYQAMLFVRRVMDEPLTPGMVLELQRTLTEGTLDDPDAAGRLRLPGEDIHVSDETGTVLHVPPQASELEGRLRAMCRFANGEPTGEFVHPAVRAIILHFWLAFDHPFVDGNGRTARALFYWAMARQGYWLCEYVSISRILKKARGQYARAFLYTETDENDLTYFLLFQLRVLLQAIRELHEYLARKAAQLRETEELVRRAAAVRADLNPRQLALLDHALKNPNARYTVDSHRRSHGVSYETARTDLLNLAKLDLVEQRKRGRAFNFIAPPDLRARLARSSAARTRR